jgi:hypothetical protein
MTHPYSSINTIRNSQNWQNCSLDFSQVNVRCFKYIQAKTEKRLLWRRYLNGMKGLVNLIYQCATFLMNYPHLSTSIYHHEWTALIYPRINWVYTNYRDYFMGNSLNWCYLTVVYTTTASKCSSLNLNTLRLFDYVCHLLCLLTVIFWPSMKRYMNL